MVLALATIGIIGGSITPRKKGRKKMASDDGKVLERRRSRKGRSKAGTKRLPRGRVVIDTDDGKLKVVVGTVKVEGESRKRIVVSRGGNPESGAQSDFSPVVIRRGSRSLKPRVTAPLTRQKISSKLATTQKMLNRMGG